MLLIYIFRFDWCQIVFILSYVSYFWFRGLYIVVLEAGVRSTKVLSLTQLWWLLSFDKHCPTMHSFNFDLFLGSFWALGPCLDWFWARVRLESSFGVPSFRLTFFLFSDLPWIPLYLARGSLWWGGVFQLISSLPQS